MVRRFLDILQTLSRDVASMVKSFGYVETGSNVTITESRISNSRDRRTIDRVLMDHVKCRYSFFFFLTPGVPETIV